MKRQGWIDMNGALAVTRQCDLAGVSRATAYAQQRPRVVDEDDQKLSRLIDEEYTRHPFYGSRRMAVMMSKAMGCCVNRKRIRRLMNEMGLQGMTPGPQTSRAHPQHPVYPYRVEITRPNQVWSSDITYIRLAKGFVYLVVVMDWYSRKVLSWRISNSMDARFCVDCLEEALRHFGKPELFNSDQGACRTLESSAANRPQPPIFDHLLAEEHHY